MSDLQQTWQKKEDYVTVITATLLCVSMDVSRPIIQGKITEIM